LLFFPWGKRRFSLGEKPSSLVFSRRSLEEKEERARIHLPVFTLIGPRPMAGEAAILIGFLLHAARSLSVNHPHGIGPSLFLAEKAIEEIEDLVYSDAMQIKCGIVPATHGFIFTGEARKNQ
jgi:hypothetical protein